MLIKKYGITIGDKLAEGIIEIGMTKDMVVDALGYDDIVLHSYCISNSMDWNDNAIEIWEYDPSKAKQYMDKEMGESAALLNLYLGLASSMGFDYKSEISKNVTYKYMKFKNNRLVEVKDSSIYDDIDRTILFCPTVQAQSALRCSAFDGKSHQQTSPISPISPRCHSNLDISQKQQPRLYLEQVVTFRE